MQGARKLHHSYQDYVLFESTSAVKHEYCNGEIYAMAGGTIQHGALAIAVSTALRNQLPHSCHVFSSDVKIRIQATDLTTYPDVSVLCGSVMRDNTDAHAILNPSIVVEVTSPSTVDYDRGEKLRNYKQLPSLQSVILVAHELKQITIYSRSNDWKATSFSIGELAVVSDPKLTLDVSQIYSVLDAL